VGEPVVVTVYFMLRDGLRLSDNPQYQAPDFQGFFVKALDEQKRYMKDGYHVTELRYILTPQKEGNFTVGPARAKVGLLDTSRRDMFGRYFNTVWKALQSNVLHIEVKPVPVDADLTGAFSLEDRLDKSETAPNKPVKLTVTIEGRGSLEDFEFPDYDIPGVSVYSDDAQVSTNVEGGVLKSRWQKTFVFIGDSDFTIPSKSFTAYDPEAKRTYTLQTHSYTVHVKGASSHASSSALPSVSNSGSNDASKVHRAAKTDAKAQMRLADEKMLWGMALAGFIVGLATAFGLTALMRKRRTIRFEWKSDDALRVLYPHTSEDKEAEEMVRLLYAKKRGEKVDIDKKRLKALLKKYER
jgi:hypothetical protein